MLKLILFLIIIQIAVAQEECKRQITTVDMSAEVGPIKNQDGIGWCYAFAASDLINQYLYHHISKSHGTDREQTISPSSLAIIYNQFAKEKPGDLLEANGNVGKLLELAFGHSICLEEQFNSSDLIQAPTTLCEGTHDNYNCGLINTLQLIYDPNASEPNSPQIEILCQRYETAHNLFPGLSNEFIWKVVTSLKRNEILPALLAQNCTFRGHRNIPRPKVKTYNVDGYESTFNPTERRYNLASKNAHLFPKIDHAIQAGKVVNISLYPGFLKDNNAPHALPDDQDPTKWKDIPKHSMTIVGMEINPETCEVVYKIKNSWGLGCSQYKRDSRIEMLQCLSSISVLRKDIPAICNDPALNLNLGRYFAKQNGTPKECNNAFKSNEELAVERKQCRENFQPGMINPNIDCEGYGYLLVPQSELAKHMYTMTYLD